VSRRKIASGAVSERDLLGDLYLAGETAVGRLSPNDITFFKNAGGGHLDLMTYETVLALT
jgi:ornithine cyclodeaminase